MSKIRDNLYRLHPGYWWEVIDSRAHLHVRWYAIRAALNWRLSEHAIESMYNVSYFQYAIDQAENRGRGKGADYIENMLKWVDVEEAIGSLRGSVETMDDWHRDAWAHRSALYFPGGETVEEMNARKAAGK